MFLYLNVIYSRWTCNLHIVQTPLCSNSQPELSCYLCGMCHMASLLLTPLPGTATATLCSETLLPVFQSQPSSVQVIILVLLAISYHLPSSGPLLLGLTTTSSSTSWYLRWRCPPHYRVHSHQYSPHPRAPRFLLQK